jgi:hypothetical protein
MWRVKQGVPGIRRALDGAAGAEANKVVRWRRWRRRGSSWLRRHFDAGRPPGAGRAGGVSAGANAALGRTASMAASGAVPAEGGASTRRRDSQTPNCPRPCHTRARSARPTVHDPRRVLFFRARATHSTTTDGQRTRLRSWAWLATPGRARRQFGALCRSCQRRVGRLPPAVGGVEAGRRRAGGLAQPPAACETFKRSADGGARDGARSSPSYTGPR